MIKVGTFVEEVPLSPTKVLIAARVSPELWTRVKAEAHRRDVTLEVAVGEALHVWLAPRGAVHPSRPVRDVEEL